MNLLAGRVISRRMLPLTASELGFDAVQRADDLLQFGGLPLVRSLDALARFLQVAALANGQVTNVAALARDAGVARPTVQGYFEVLSDTLLGQWLPAWRARARVKEVAHPKFYLFDTGVVRALSGRLRQPLEGAERGVLLETLIHHELSAHLAYAQCGGDLSYYRTPSGSGVDFTWQRGGTRVGIEVKSGAQWRPEFGRTLQGLLAEGVVKAGFGVYLGDTALQDGSLRVLPLGGFLRELQEGRVIPAAGRSPARPSA